MYLYSFSSCYPLKHSTGWTNGVQGICHDSSNWYIAQNGNLWKIPLEHDLNDSIDAPSENILKIESNFQFGDIDYYDGYIYVPVLRGHGPLDDKYVCKNVLPPEEEEEEVGLIQSDEPKIFIFRAKDFKYVRRVAIKKMDGKNYFHSLSWVAIRDGYLYTSEKNTDRNNLIHVYKIDTTKGKHALNYHSTIELCDEDFAELPLKSIQGGCFDDAGFLNLSFGEINVSNVEDFHNTGINVFSVPSTSSKSTGMASRINKSYRYSQKGDDSFLFSTPIMGDIPSGLTYWDLSNKANVPSDEYKSHLHAILLNRKGEVSDKVSLYHYKRNPKSTFYEITIVFGKIDEEIPNYPFTFRMKGENGWGTYQKIIPFYNSNMYMKAIEEKEDLGPFLTAFDLMPYENNKTFYLVKIGVKKLGYWLRDSGNNIYINLRTTDIKSDSKGPDLGISHDWLNARYITLINRKSSVARVVLDAETLVPKHNYFVDIELPDVVQPGKNMHYDLAKFEEKYKSGDHITLKLKINGVLNNPDDDYNFIFDRGSYNNLIFEISEDPKNYSLEYLGMTKIVNNNIFIKNYPRIRYLSLTNKAGLVARLQALITPRNEPDSSIKVKLTGDIRLGETEKFDLKRISGINPADIVVMKVEVVWGDDKIALEKFYFDENSNQTACYEISGALPKHKLNYKGVE